MKKHRITLTTLMMVAALAVAILYAATSAFASTLKTNNALPISTNVAVTAANINSASISVPNKTSYITKQQVNGIEVEITGKQVTDNFLLVDMCFQMPDNKDWLLGARPDDIVLTVGDQVIAHSGWTLIDEKTNAAGSAVRCDQVKFQLSGQEDLSKFEITVNHLVTSIPEIPDCDKAQVKLDKNNAGIKIKCSKTDSAFSYEISQKPKAMDDYTARQSIDSAFRDSIDGPWVFTDSINN